MLASIRKYFFAPTCACCGTRLSAAHILACPKCLANLPRLHAGAAGNPVEGWAFGRIPYEHGTAFFRYSAQSPYARLIRCAKYRGQSWRNRAMAQLFATELIADGWPFDIDALVPIPIHWYRRLLRGYNQAYYVALGLSDIWHLPVESDTLIKSRYTPSLVKCSPDERYRRVRNSFKISHPERLEGKHILLVDDVLTSGATLDTCCQAIAHSCPNTRISFLTLAFAH